MESLRLAFVTDFFPPYVGGAPHLQWELARRVAARGHEVEVVTTRLPSTEAVEIREGVRILRLGGEARVRRYSFAGRSLPAVRRIAARADALQATTFIAAAPGSIGARLAHCPSLLTVYEVFGKDWTGYVANPFVSRGLRMAETALLRLPFDQHVAISEYTAARLREHSRGRIKPNVVYPGIDESFWRPDPNAKDRFRSANNLGDRFVYLYYGRAGISKGVLGLLDAAERFGREEPASRLFLVLSPGEVEAKALQRIESSPVLRDHVVIRRGLDRDSLRDAVQGADCVVVPSLAEGFGFTATEPGQVGTPVIATRVGAVPEVISGSHLLVPPGDPQSMLEALRKARRGEWDRTPLKRFSWDTTTTHYERILSTMGSA
ncbi:MAG: glycosyltransferase family 4 protein [Candidatus Thermoplasmatota archaeon]|jgi:glycosyltransferase involved in cell wall biosynthesis